MPVLLLAARAGYVGQPGLTFGADEAHVSNAAGVHLQGPQASAACCLDLARWVHSRQTWAHCVYGPA